MTNEIQKRSQRFAELFGSELKGAMASHGYSQGQVADELGHARSSMSNWLNAKPPIDVAVGRKICDYIGVDMRSVVDSANNRLEEELGPWPPIEVNPDALSDDERRRIVLEKLRNGDVRLAAYEDKNKEAERDADPDAGA